METLGLFPRHVSWVAREALTDTPVVMIQGARQVGKSTLAAELARSVPTALHVTLDDPATLAVARSDPAFFVQQAGDGLLVIDEAQRAPGLILPLKALVDRDRRPGRALLTGSTDLLQVKGVGDSLAGRAETIELMPLSQGEINRRQTPEDFLTWLASGAQGSAFPALTPSPVVRGGYPEATLRKPTRTARWFSSYIERLTNHDARELQHGGYADHLRTLLELIASGGRAELVKARLARDLGVAENSVDAYLRLATAMRLVTSLPAWGRSPRGRVSRRPKVCLNDTGLAAYLARFTEAQATAIGGREYFGMLIEQFVALELHKQTTWSTDPARLFHYRSHAGDEVDIVAELPDGRLVAIEVKSTQTVTAKAWAGLERFRLDHPDRTVIGVVLHGGANVAHLHEWLHLLPISSLWMH
ncbi:MAG: ATP-binding protein [Micropruina sp.]